MNVHILDLSSNTVALHVPLHEAFPDPGEAERGILQHRHATTLRLGGGAAPEVLVMRADSPNGWRVEGMAAALRAYEAHEKGERSWVHGSLWDKLNREGMARVCRAFADVLQGDFHP